MPVIVTFFLCYCTLSALSYLGLMIYFKSGIKQVYKPSTISKTPSTFISVIVCFRNEEEHLPQLIKSLLAQNYPASKYEILFYNDASTDGSVAAVKNAEAHHQSHQIICRDVTKKDEWQSAKKLAINHAAAHSKADLIVTTDADCTLNQNWLATLEQCYAEKSALMIAAPVTIEAENGWISTLQNIEMQALTAVTAGAFGHKKPIMCNGANMGFDRKMFLKLDPYQNNLHISSGDDMFLMMAMQEHYCQSMFFVAHQNAVVNTKGKYSIKAYLNQKIRWASKSKNYQNKLVKAVAILVLNMNALLLFSPLFMFYDMMNGFILFAALAGVKQIADMLIMQEFSKVIKQELSYFKLLIFQYIEALLTFIIAIQSVRGSYEWKGRKQQF